VRACGADTNDTKSTRADIVAIHYGIDALLVAAPLLGMSYFLFDPEAFNAFTAWLMRVL
jgi:hypothetical protein